jgi:hypothetical protein
MNTQATTGAPRPTSALPIAAAADLAGRCQRLAESLEALEGGIKALCPAHPATEILPGLSCIRGSAGIAKRRMQDASARARTLWDEARAALAKTEGQA